MAARSARWTAPMARFRWLNGLMGMPHKYVALEDPNLCVSCGICVGSCDTAAVTMGDIHPAMVVGRMFLPAWRWPKQSTGARAGQSDFYLRTACGTWREDLIWPMRRMFRRGWRLRLSPCLVWVPLPRICWHGTLDSGMAEVQVVGCPPDDCTNREGNLWAEQRLIRERVPRLKRPYANAPISAYWLPPDDFAQAAAAAPLPAHNGEAEPVDYLEQRRMFKELSWRNYIVAFILLAAVMVLQVLLTDLPLTLYPDPPAMTQAIVSDLAASIGRTSYISGTLGPELALTLEVDGEPVFTDML